MAERADGCSGETLLAPYTRKKRLQSKGRLSVVGEITPILAENIRRQFFFVISVQGRRGCRVTVMAEVTPIFAVTIRRQFFFVINTTASTP